VAHPGNSLGEALISLLPHLSKIQYDWNIAAAAAVFSAAALGAAGACTLHMLLQFLIIGGLVGTVPVSYQLLLS